MATYQFYAELEDYKPKMWRRFLINENMTIAQLSYAVLTIFRANGSHLFNIEKPCKMVLKHFMKFQTQIWIFLI